MISLRNYSGNVFRFNETIRAIHGGREVSVIGVNGRQDHLVIGGFRDDFLVPADEFKFYADQAKILTDQLAKAKKVIS